MEYEGIGDQYQQLTRYIRGSLPGGGLGLRPKPSLRKTYKNPLRTVGLPPPVTAGGPKLWEALQARRSIRSYTLETLTLQELSQLLWATQGATTFFRGFPYRSAPSAGALYPVETYLVVNRVEGLDPGLYHYDAFDAVLQLLKEGGLGAQAAAASLDQPMAAHAAVAFVWTAIVERGKWKYRERAYRYIYLDAGHIGQNLCLAATALGLGCCTIGAFYDEEVNRLVDVDGVSETALYMGAVGKL
jgi:SagB-type dehydrogenase family enzyme